MLIINKDKEKGLSLIELLLVVVTVAIIVMAGFRFWESNRAKVTSDQSVALLLHLGKSVKNALRFSNQTQFTGGTLDSASLQTIVSSALDSKYKNGNGFITPAGNLNVVYGGLLIPNPTLNQNFGVNFTISGMDRRNCSLLVTSDIKNEFSQIRVNNLVTSELKLDRDGAETSLLVGACSQDGYNNTVRLDVAFNEIFSEENNVITQAEAYVRNTDDLSFVGSIDNSAYTGTQACTGGSSWNAATNKCGCPANSRWMGATEGCVAFNSVGNMSVNMRAGVCNLNDGFSQNTGRCEVLNPTNTAATGVYYNGKHLPTHSVNNNINGANMPATVATLTPVQNHFLSTPAVTEEIAGRVITVPSINANSAYSSNCIIGTKSNNRCLPPATPPVGTW